MFAGSLGAEALAHGDHDTGDFDAYLAQPMKYLSDGKRVLQSLVLIIQCTLLAACSSVTPYPNNWEPVESVAESSCPDMAGTYRNVGEEVDGTNRRDAYLGAYFRDYTEAFPSVGELTHISIEHGADNEIQVSYWIDADLVYKNAFPCANGQFADQVNPHGFGSIGISRVMRRFSRANDGALIISTSMDSKGMGYLVPIPIIDHQTWWVRFGPYLPK